MSEIICDRKKPFSCLEKDLFLKLIDKYDNILTCKKTNGTSVLRKKQAWNRIQDEFNSSPIVSHKASVKQLTKLWYNMKAKAREAKTRENVRFLTGGGPSVEDMDTIDAKVIAIDKNILTNIEVDIDSDVNGKYFQFYNPILL
ncbi:myb/SANT-like DNA-binding domain-containing protein 3 [Achroia grisella]|uniref:myb/SANT-like DNA-binding domain-containing protein 3 n=1 Tax=Achroia grisella TaxID=688607 RepID=UPI0027D2A5A2|nr:myb/SANT-like DNA-binding domain-containing protein 3 [Achroia grisella]